MGHRGRNGRAIRVVCASTRPLEPPRQLRRAEVQRRHRDTARVVDANGREEESAAGGGDAVGVEETVLGRIVEAGGVFIHRPAAAADQDGVDAASLCQALAGRGHAVAEKQPVPPVQRVVVAEEASGGVNRAVARRWDVDQEAVVCDVPHREFSDPDRGFRVIGTVQADGASIGEAEGIRGRVGAAGSLAVLGGSCRDRQSDGNHRFREEDQEGQQEKTVARSLEPKHLCLSSSFQLCSSPITGTNPHACSIETTILKERLFFQSSQGKQNLTALILNLKTLHQSDLSLRSLFFNHLVVFLSEPPVQPVTQKKCRSDWVKDLVRLGFPWLQVINLLTIDSVL
ncbi:hypothetical protein GW17_00048738 [Ensete ventricosum]|nr:hypothetical protein GW17_00048738 [Ensete ventricosum]